MQFTIIIPFRPSILGMNSKNFPVKQLENYEWVYDINGKEESYGRSSEHTINRCIKAIIKNSIYKHKIIVIIDHDMEYREDWLTEFGYDISIYKCKNNKFETPQERESYALKECILSLPDDILLSYHINPDNIVSKKWDYYIEQSLNKYGDEYLHVPLFVEPRGEIGRCNLSTFGMEREEIYTVFKNESETLGETTPEKIWNDWRKICCHSLTIKPIYERDYMIEKDLDDFIEISNKYNHGNKADDMGIIMEPCGARDKGYWVGDVTTCGRFKKIIKDMVCKSGWDLWLDYEMRHQVKAKAIVTKSFIFHLHMPCILDDKIMGGN